MATDNKDFFKTQTDSSRVKATIISEYFPSYCKIIGRHHVPKKFGYYDMFAGPGMYEDGGLSTPLLVAGKCAKDSCNRIYLRDESNFTKSNSANAVWTRHRFQGIATLVDYRRKDMSRITQDQIDFLAQRNNSRGKKTMKAYYWYIRGFEWDSVHPRN